ncbi:MAG: YciI family protein [Mycobacteriales bacterium]|nr:YciI family protein [Frankia sp.]
MTQYLLSVYMREGEPEPSPDQMQLMFKQVDEVNEEIKASGAWVFAGGLHPATTATVVQSRDGEALVTDGPFPESKEQLGGFWVLECADLDAALDWAKKCTVACMSPVEVRPFQDDAG